MIRLFTYPRSYDVPNLDPLCLEVESYLRMAKLPFEQIFINKGTLPYIKNENIQLSGVSNILGHLNETYSCPLDRHLSTEAIVVNRILSKRCKTVLEWALTYQRWISKKGYEKSKEIISPSLNDFQRMFSLPIMRAKAYLHLSTLDKDVLREIRDLLDTLSDYLNEKRYFHGEKVSSIDATLFAYLSNIFFAPFEGPVKDYLRKKENLLMYTVRLEENFFCEDSDFEELKIISKN